MLYLCRNAWNITEKSENKRPDYGIINSRMIIEIKVYNLIHIHMSSGSEMTLMLKHWTVIGDVDSIASKQQEMKNHIEISHSLSVYSKPVSRSVFKCLYRICWYYFYSVRNPPQPTLCAVTITQSETWLFSSLRSTKPDSPSKSSQFQCNSAWSVTSRYTSGKNDLCVNGTLV